MIPVSQHMLTVGCYLTALVLNGVIAVYVATIAKRLGGDGVFARMARWAWLAALAFAVCNGLGAWVGAESLALLALETAGASLLLTSSYSLYTLVKV